MIITAFKGFDILEVWFFGRWPLALWGGMAREECHDF